MNTALALEIYRGIWMIHGSESSFRSILSEARIAANDNAERLNSISVHNINATGLIESGVSAQKNTDQISYTNISGVITKSGGSSSRGMQELSAELLAADRNPSVIGHLIKLDTPGGSESAMRYMKTTLSSLQKPKVTMVTRQGMAASAGLGILVEGDYVMAESEDAEIGSHGVMWGTSGVPNGEKDGNGEVHFVVIADSSPEKNKATFDAINKNDTSLMQKEVGAKHEAFKSSTRSLRPNAKEEHMSGGMFSASEMIGSMIDAIGTEQQAVAKIVELSKSSKGKLTLTNKNKNAMTAAEIKSAHPEAFAEIFSAGRDAESERVKTWQVYSAIDQEAVNKGIASGKELSSSEQNAFLLKAASTSKIESLESNSAPDLAAPQAEGAPKAPEADEKEFASIYGKHKVSLNPQLN